MNAVDTNVFVYALDDNEPSKQVKARALLQQLVALPTSTILPWQVACEVLSCLRRWEHARRLSSSDAAAHFYDLLAMFPLAMPSERAFQLSFDLRSRFSLSHWDSMLLAAC